MPNLPNRRTWWLTAINVIVLAGIFKWTFPEASVADVPVVIAFIAWGGATITDVLLSKFFHAKRSPEHVNED